ncbi:prolipoprotein diacylglyceryl transferase [uncultured Pedobacter sp.]|uniref:prolipoprotein diacylglyceryl transferase n=1 Tax=uncultured Pedobacter sp. TaxID=246139 RepID=UPI0025DD1B5A|nr:prolipoprotein diacylglyceryl transferase [uncultured Pedobacter sp.]
MTTDVLQMILDCSVFAVSHSGIIAVHNVISNIDLLAIRWNVNPEIFDIGRFSLRYYSLCFVAAFFTSYLILQHNFLKAHKPQRLLDALTVYVFVGTIIGARLGHCLFYEFDYYRHHLLEIILPYKFSKDGTFQLTGYQGLASHGGAVGILLSVLLFCKKYRQSFFYMADQLVIVVAISSFFIRIGNLFNSEIIGRPSALPWAFIFERIDNVPRHPAQLYEAIAYLLLFFFLGYYYKMKTTKHKSGYLFGLFLVLLFSIRFLIEFIKEPQEAFENNMDLDMGQWLSIPFIAIGIYLMYIKRLRPNKKTLII